MSNVEDNILFYEKNVLRSLPNWNLLSNATVSMDMIIISPGGSAGYSLANTYNNGLKASLYRKVNVSATATIGPTNNYGNGVELVIKGKYKDDNGDEHSYYSSVAVTQLRNSAVGTTSHITRVLAVPNFDFTQLVVYMVNHTNTVVTLNSCSMKRSQDITSSQVGESIGFGIALNKVIAYTDGCEVYYDGDETPTKMWWQEDAEGNFSGINVNNERLIKFERVNEILVD